MRRALFALLLTTGCSGAHQHHGAHHDGSGFHHGFKDAEEWSKTFDAADRDAWQKPAEVVAALGITPGMRVADLGAGTGYFLPYLSKATGPTGQVVGLDVEPDMVTFMKARAEKEQLANVTARQVQADDPGLEPASLDRVLCVDTWHHIDARPTYAKKLAAGLKPGGALYIVDFTLEATQGPPKEHRLAPEAVLAELTEAGFTAELVPETLPDQYIVRGTLPAAK